MYVSAMSRERRWWWYRNLVQECRKNRWVMNSEGDAQAGSRDRQDEGVW